MGHTDETTIPGRTTEDRKDIYKSYSAGGLCSQLSRRRTLSHSSLWSKPQFRGALFQNEGGAKPTKLAHGSVAFRLDGKAAGVDGDVGGTTGSYRW